MIDNLPFVCAEYKKYKRSFLNQAMVTLSFDAVEADEDKEKAWQDYVRATFGVSSEKSIFEVPVVLCSNDKLLSFMFYKDQVAVRISGKGYKNFADTIVPQVYKMRRFIEKIAGVEAKVCSARILKVNAWEIECSSDIMKVSDGVRNKLFSESYNDSKSSEEGENIKDIPLIDRKTNVWKNENEEFFIHTGWIKTKDKENLYRMLLYSGYDVKNKPAIALNDVDNKLGDMNYTLFTAFEWTVSEMVKELMKQ